MTVNPYDISDEEFVELATCAPQGLLVRPILWEDYHVSAPAPSGKRAQRLSVSEDTARKTTFLFKVLKVGADVSIKVGEYIVPIAQAVDMITTSARVLYVEQEDVRVVLPKGCFEV
jgi:hypothetical protein